jgi:hypothetical protein
MSEETKVWCPNSFCNRFKLYCIYGCPDKVECGVYERNYESFKGMEIPESYILKYGNPEFPLPNSIILKEKLHTKKEKEAAKKEKEELKLNKKVARERKKQMVLKEKEDKKKVRELKRAEKDVPKPKVKRTRRTKAEMMLTRGVVPTEVPIQTKVKTKRTRRTKLQMQEARGSLTKSSLSLLNNFFA